MNETIDSVLRYWFGEGQSAFDVSSEKKQLWWAKNPEVDAEITNRFSDLVDAVAAGELDHWIESSSGLLASIICTDQFPRNIYRGRSKAFSYDAVALRLANQAVAMGMDRELPLIRRVFVYLPFEHSEEISVQEEAVKLFRSLLDEAEESEKKVFAGFLQFAERHHEVIARFGRFPHRNSIFGRASTEEEIAFLEQPGSSF